MNRWSASVSICAASSPPRGRFEVHFGVPTDITLADLTRVVLFTFQQDDDHLNSFQIGAKRYGAPYLRGKTSTDRSTRSWAPRSARLRARGQQRLKAVFDVGDEWLNTGTCLPLTAATTGDRTLGNVIPELA
jgi:hypothetical protein